MSHKNNLTQKRMHATLSLWLLNSIYHTLCKSWRYLNGAARCGVPERVLTN